MSWLWLASWGGLVGLDSTSVAQLMLSRPLVAATLTGAIYGRPAEGLVLGLILELAALPIVPVGAAAYPEPGTAAVAATAGYSGALSAQAAGTVGIAEALLVAVVFALAWERLAGRSVTALRRMNERWVASGPLDAGMLERRHLAAIGLDLVRGAGVTLVGAWVAMHGIGWVVSHSALTASVALGALTVLSAGMAGTLLILLGGVRNRALVFGLGVLCGWLILLVR